MAITTEIHCETCGDIKGVMHRPDHPAPKICYECQVKQNAKSRREYLDELGKLSVEDRLSKIEAWIYDFKIPTPLSEMLF